MGCKQTTFQSETLPSSQGGGSGGSAAAAEPLVNHRYSTGNTRKFHLRALMTAENPLSREPLAEGNRGSLTDYLLPSNAPPLSVLSGCKSDPLRPEAASLHGPQEARAPSRGAGRQGGALSCPNMASLGGLQSGLSAGAPQGIPLPPPLPTPRFPLRRVPACINEIILGSIETETGTPSSNMIRFPIKKNAKFHFSIHFFNPRRRVY